MIIGLDDQMSPSNHPFPQVTVTQTRFQQGRYRTKHSPVLQPRQMGGGGQENNQDALVLGGLRGYRIQRQGLRVLTH